MRAFWPGPLTLSLNSAWKLFEKKSPKQSLVPKYRKKMSNDVGQTDDGEPK